MDQRNPKRFRFIFFYFTFVMGLIISMIITLSSDEYSWALVAYLTLTAALLILTGIWAGAKWLFNRFFSHHLAVAKIVK